MTLVSVSARGLPAVVDGYGSQPGIPVSALSLLLSPCCLEYRSCPGFFSLTSPCRSPHGATLATTGPSPLQQLQGYYSTYLEGIGGGVSMSSLDIGMPLFRSAPRSGSSGVSGICGSMSYNLHNAAATGVRGMEETFRLSIWLL